LKIRGLLSLEFGERRRHQPLPVDALMAGVLDAVYFAGGGAERRPRLSARVTEIGAYPAELPVSPSSKSWRRFTTASEVDLETSFPAAGSAYGLVDSGQANYELF